MKHQDFNLINDETFLKLDNIFNGLLYESLGIDISFLFVPDFKHQQGISSSGFGNSNIHSVVISYDTTVDNVFTFINKIFLSKAHEAFHEFRKRFPEKLTKLEAFTFLSHEDKEFYRQNYPSDITEITAESFAYSFVKLFYDSLYKENLISNEQHIFLKNELLTEFISYYKDSKYYTSFFKKENPSLETIPTFFTSYKETSLSEKKMYSNPSFFEKCFNKNIYTHNIEQNTNPLEQLKEVCKEIILQSDYFKLKAISGSSLIQSSPHLKEYRDLLKDRIEEERNKPEIQKFLEKNSGRF